MKINPQNKQLLQKRLKSLVLGRSVKRHKVKMIAIDFAKRHVLEFQEKKKRPPLVDEVFDEIAGTLIDELKACGNKAHLIAKFIAVVFYEIIFMRKK